MGGKGKRQEKREGKGREGKGEEGRGEDFQAFPQFQSCHYITGCNNF